MRSLLHTTYGWPPSILVKKVVDEALKPESPSSEKDRSDTLLFCLDSNGKMILTGVMNDNEYKNSWRWLGVDQLLDEKVVERGPAGAAAFLGGGGEGPTEAGACCYKSSY